MNIFTVNESLIKWVAIGIVAATLTIPGLALGLGEARASDFTPTDDTPSAVTLLTYALLESDQNDTVSRIFYEDAKSDWVKREMLQGAYTHCGSTELYEDFSCK